MALTRNPHYERVPTPVRRAVTSPVSRMYSRVEFYERNGKTPFKPTDMLRVIDGSVSVDMDRDERRAFDLTLENYDEALTIEKKSIWYNKIIKIFKGVYLPDAFHEGDVRIAVTGRSSTAATKRLVNSARQMAMNTGADSVRAFGQDITLEDVEDYNILICATGTTTIANTKLLKEFMDSGRDVITISTQATGVPHITGSTSEPAQTDILAMPINDAAGPGSSGWDFWQYSINASQHKPTAVASGVEITARRADGTPAVMHMTSKANDEGSWTHIHMDPPRTSEEISEADEFIQLLRVIIAAVKNDIPEPYWEMQIGEFEIDTIKTQSFPRTVALSGRDRVKTCMGSKFEATTAYKRTKAGPKQRIIRSLAANAGIEDFYFPDAPNTLLQANHTYDIGTSRWEVMKEYATSMNCDLYFDHEGRLVLKRLEDVAGKAVHEVFTAGETGNMVDFSKSSDDNEMYNVIVVSNEASDDKPTITAVAKNTNSNSATSIQQIGQRLKSYTSKAITTKKEAETLAKSYLKTAGLHSYTIDITTLQFFWLEAGMIIQFEDPHAIESEPSRFLLTSFTIPLGLETMSLNAKRLVIAS